MNSTIKEVEFFNDIDCLISFPNVIDPRKNKDGSVTYDVTQVINPANPRWVKREAAVRNLALRTLQNKFGQTAQFSSLQAKTEYHSPFRPDSDYILDKYPYYKGMIMIPCRSKDQAPDLVRIDGSSYLANTNDKGQVIPPTPAQIAQAKKELYPGACCIVSFGFYAYDYKDKESGASKKGVSGALRCVMKVRDSQPFVNRASAERDFADFNPEDYQVDNSAMFSGMRDL